MKTVCGSEEFPFAHNLRNTLVFESAPEKAGEAEGGNRKREGAGPSTVRPSNEMASLA